jgi:DNA-binding response OmpR family regulator
MKLLIIEDSTRLRNSLSAGFTRLGYSVDSSGDGKEGLSFAMINDYDVIILDLMLPSMDGISILKELRNSHRNTHVLILSAKDQIEDRVAGLNYGADDYLIKPFSFDELNARLLTLTRRKYNISSALIKIDNLLIDTVLRKASVDNLMINLTPTEYLILEHLALNVNRVISYDALINQIYSSEEGASRNTLEAHVSTLRKKLSVLNLTDLIKTKRVFGYYIERK